MLFHLRGFHLQTYPTLNIDKLRVKVSGIFYVASVTQWELRYEASRTGCVHATAPFMIRTIPLLWQKIGLTQVAVGFTSNRGKPLSTSMGLSGASQSAEFK